MNWISVVSILNLQNHGTKYITYQAAGPERVQRPVAQAVTPYAQFFEKNVSLFRVFESYS